MGEVNVAFAFEFDSHVPTFREQCTHVLSVLDLCGIVLFGGVL